MHGLSCNVKNINPSLSRSILNFCLDQKNERRGNVEDLIMDGVEKKWPYKHGVGRV